MFPKPENFLTEAEKEALIDLNRVAMRLERQAADIFAAIEYCKRNQTTKGLDEMVAMAFNAQQHTPQYGGGGKSLPANDDGTPRRYKGVIVNSSQANVEKQGVVTGGYLALEIAVIEGPLTGQTHTDRLNLHNTNSQTVEIANKQLSAYCHVLGKFQFQDTAELHNIPFQFDIELQKAPNPNNYTQVKAIFDINGNEPGKAGAGPQAQQQPAAPSQAPPAGVAATGGWGGAPQQQQQQPSAQQPPAGGAPAQAAPAPQQQQAAPAPQQQQAGWGAPAAGQQGGPPPGWGAPAA